MASRGYELRQAVSKLGEEIQELAWTVGRDPHEDAKLRRRWGILESVVGAVFTIGARRLGSKAWLVLTGEEPPRRR